MAPEIEQLIDAIRTVGRVSDAEALDAILECLETPLATDEAFDAVSEAAFTARHRSQRRRGRAA